MSDWIYVLVAGVAVAALVGLVLWCVRGRRGAGDPTDPGKAAQAAIRRMDKDRRVRAKGTIRGKGQGDGGDTGYSAFGSDGGGGGI